MTPLMRPPGPGDQIGCQWSPPTRGHRDRNGSSSNTRLMESLPVRESCVQIIILPCPSPSHGKMLQLFGAAIVLGPVPRCGHPREKHLVYVVGAGSRATHCKNAAANGLPLAEKTAKSHSSSKCKKHLFFTTFSPGQ